MWFNVVKIKGRLVSSLQMVTRVKAVLLVTPSFRSSDAIHSFERKVGSDFEGYVKNGIILAMMKF